MLVMGPPKNTGMHQDWSCTWLTVQDTEHQAGWSRVVTTHLSALNLQEGMGDAFRMQPHDAGTDEEGLESTGCRQETAQSHAKRINEVAQYKDPHSQLRSESKSLDEASVKPIKA